MKCPYCKDDLVAIADGTTEWRCTECDTWIEPIELKRAADGECPCCGISRSAPHPHDLVRDLRTALGWPDIAIPQPPKAVWAEALAEVRRLRHNDPSTGGTHIMSEPIWAGSVSATIGALGRLAGADPDRDGLAGCLQAAANRIRRLEAELDLMDNDPETGADHG